MLGMHSALASRPRSRALWLVVLALSSSTACNFLSVAHPPRLPPTTTTLRPPTENPGPIADVDLTFDESGVPHVRAESEEDLAYGLGFAHGRDRAFQIDVLRHAAHGELTALFGEDFLGTDGQLRLLTYRLAEQEQMLSVRDLALATAYANGVNAGARHAGPSSEMRLLRRSFEPFTVTDVLAICRLQAWGLSADFEAELLRERALRRLPPDDPRRAELVRGVPSLGVPIVPSGRATGAPTDVGGPKDDGSAPPEETPELEPPNLDDELPLTPLVPSGAPSQTQSPRTTDSPTARAVLDLLGLTTRGASNAWVVEGARTKEGVPVVVNDPHLRHQAPSVFYLAHLAGKDFDVVGATFPGVPAVVIGHSRSLAWGMTTSLADTQDVVRIERDPQRTDRYIVDGKPRAFGRWVQRFEQDGEVLQSQVWRTTIFGPVLPPAFDYLTEPGVTYALLWAGFDPSIQSENISGFWDLARARSLDEARAALEKVGTPSQNVVIGVKDGDIGYHLMGKIPRRQNAAPVDRPRDGRASDAGWSGYLAMSEKPSLTNPPEGYIVTANQRVVDDGAYSSALGVRGLAPYRALRIHERLSVLLSDLAQAEGKKPDAATLTEVQQDVVSVEARRLAPHFARTCPSEVTGHPKDRVVAYCSALQQFDHSFDVSNAGALAFVWTHEALVVEILATHLGTDLALLMKDDPATLLAIEDAILREAAGEEPVLLDDLRTSEREGLAGFMARAAPIALDRLSDEDSSAPFDWRWGRVHTLAFKSPLAELPLVGGVFQTSPAPEAGHRSTIRAEGGTPVRTGAVFRMAVVVGDTPKGHMILDLGQSGHVGHPNAVDMRGDWSTGKLREMHTAKEKIPVAARLILEPRAKEQAPVPGT